MFCRSRFTRLTHGAICRKKNCELGVIEFIIFWVLTLCVFQIIHWDFKGLFFLEVEIYSQPINRSVYQKNSESPNLEILVFSGQQQYALNCVICESTSVLYIQNAILKPFSQVSFIYIVQYNSTSAIKYTTFPLFYIENVLTVSSNTLSVETRNAERRREDKNERGMKNG